MNIEQCKENIQTYHYHIAIPHATDEDTMQLVHTISDWTHGEHMLPKTPEDISGFIDRQHSVIVYAHDEPVGHAAITYLYQSKPQVEIGSIVVHPNWRRGKSVGTVATMAILEHAKGLYPKFTPIALANPQSSSLLLGMGAKTMDTALVDPEAWIFCDTCPKKPIQPKDGTRICCDTPYDLSPLAYPESLYYQLWVSLKMRIAET